MGRCRVDCPKIGCAAHTLLNWVRRDEVDAGTRPGVTSAEAQRIKDLEREVKELRRANEDEVAGNVDVDPVASSFAGCARPQSGGPPSSRHAAFMPYQVSQRVGSALCR